MAQIAARAGVCKATVSLALRNDPRISAGAIKRVQRVAADLGYTRNPIIDELMSQLRRARGSSYQRTLALLNAHPDPRAFTANATVPSWVTGCRRRASYLGYTTDEFWLHNSELDGPRLLRILSARGIRGVIIIGAFSVDSIPESFAEIWPKLACVVTGIRTRSPALSFTCVDHHNLVLDAMTEVRALGYRRPGLVIGESVDRVTDGRFTGSMWLAQQALPSSQRVPTLTALSPGDGGYDSFAVWYQEHRPDVVLTLHTEVAKWMDRLGCAVPRDLGLVHLERNRLTQDWAGMDQHNDIAGEAAVDMLAGLLHNHEMGVPAFPRATLIGATWVNGRSVRAKALVRAAASKRRA